MGFNTFSGSGGAASAVLDYLPEIVGHSNGAGTMITGNATAHALSTWQSLGTTSSAFSGFDIECSAPSGASNRYLLYLSLDGGSTTFFGPILVLPASTNRTQRFSIPRLAVPAGSTIHVAIRSSAATSPTLKVMIIGKVSQSASNPPDFTVATNLTTADTAATRASSTSVAASTDATTWQRLAASLASEFKAFIVFFGSGSNPANSQGVTIRLAKDAGGAKTVIGARHAWFGGVGQMNGAVLVVNATVPAGQNISLNIQGPSADSTIAGLIGLR